jgi:hypothetical protein
VQDGSISPDPAKLAAIRDWPEPLTGTEKQKRKNLKGFLGICNFFRRVCQSFAHTAHPLYDLTSDATPWRWGDTEHAASTSLKAALCSEPVVVYAPDMFKPFLLQTDAGERAVGGVLMQQEASSPGSAPCTTHPKVVAYMSHKLKGCLLL